jgi:hypothetical protein
MAWKRYFIGLGLMVILVGALWGLLKAGGQLPWWMWLGGLIMIPALMKRVEHETDRSTGRAIRGAIAEESVATELEKLDDRFHVIHDVIVGPGNIDHVVIGPAGLFTVETKSHRGHVTFDGEKLLLGGRPFEKNFLAQAYAESMALKEYLKKATGHDFDVRPLLVFTNGFVQVRGRAKGVEILPLKWMNARLARGGETLSEEMRQRLARALAMLTDQARRAP